MKLNKNIAALFLPIVILFSGCTGNNPITSSIRGTQTLILTNTISPSPGPTSTSQPTSTEEIQSTCVQIVDQLPKLEDLKGNITVNAGREQLIFDAKTGETIPLVMFQNVVVSPDHTMIAFLDFTDIGVYNDPVIITDHVGEKLYSIPSDDYYPVQWLDTNHIFMVKLINKFDSSNPQPARILTIDSRNIEEIPFDFPSLTFQRNIPGQNWYRFAFSARMNVSPDRGYILYPFEGTNTPIGDLVVWDRNLNQEAFRIPGLDVVSVEPTWSPDGNRFAIGIFKTSFAEIKYPREAGYDILIADVEGNINRFNPSEDSLGYVNFLSWSPDGKKLAFLYSDFGIEYNAHYAGKLMVLDFETGEITDYCIEGNYYIFWSLDGNYLFLTTPVGFYEEKAKITLVSLSELWVVDIYENASVTGVVVEE